MKGKRYTTEQKIRVRREAERTDKTILDVYQKQQISEQTFHRWKRQFGMMRTDKVKRLHLNWQLGFNFAKHGLPSRCFKAKLTDRKQTHLNHQSESALKFTLTERLNPSSL
ncbi:MAG TPA: hypothetical protein DIV79_07155 [Opitutae bacterium]|nr:hypothetical protein [Opitutae bacterium]